MLLNVQVQQLVPWAVLGVRQHIPGRFIGIVILIVRVGGEEEHHLVGGFDAEAVGGGVERAADGAGVEE